MSYGPGLPPLQGPAFPKPPSSDSLAPSMPLLATPRDCPWEEAVAFRPVSEGSGLAEHRRLWGVLSRQKEEGPGSIVKHDFSATVERPSSRSQPRGLQNSVDSGDSCGCASQFTDCGYSFDYCQAGPTQGSPTLKLLQLMEPLTLLRTTCACPRDPNPAASALYLGNSSSSCCGR